MALDDEQLDLAWSWLMLDAAAWRSLVASLLKPSTQFWIHVPSQSLIVLAMIPRPILTSIDIANTNDVR